jgi:prepilin-type N-terminal cleavage/methylation domain-containing protein
MKKSGGFTLMELAVTIAITGILTAVVAGILTITIDSYNLFNAHSTMSRESQDAFRIMSDKIGMAMPGTITTSTSRQFRFFATNGEEIRFQFRNGPKIFRYRIIGSPWRELIHNMTNFTFSYFKHDGTGWVVSDPVDEINRVTVSFGLSYLGETQNHSFNFTIRNL